MDEALRQALTRSLEDDGLNPCGYACSTRTSNPSAITLTNAHPQPRHTHKLHGWVEETRVYLIDGVEASRTFLTQLHRHGGWGFLGSEELILRAREHPRASTTGSATTLSVALY